MYRSAASRLRALKGQTRRLAVARYATLSAVVATGTSSPGHFSWLAGGNSGPLPPLELPLKDVSLPGVLPDFVEPSVTKAKILSNGLTIVSEASPNPAASIGLYIDCGSVYETPITRGATHVLYQMAFKRTRNRSHSRIVSEVEATGGNVAASSSPEQMGYTFDAIKIYVPQMVELLVDAVRNPVFMDKEVNYEIKKIKNDIWQLSNSPQAVLLEAIRSAGYIGALANPILAPESTLERLSPDVLQKFVSEHYTAPRMVIAASGVELEDLVAVAEPLLSDLPAVPGPAEPKPQYVGGDYRRQSYSMTHVVLAFEVPGGWRNEKEAMILILLEILMGGRGSLFVGGPRKGLMPISSYLADSRHSRLYARVLNNEYQELQSFSTFKRIFNNTGLFGIYACTTADFATKAIDLAANELIAIATPGQVTRVELNRAKDSTKSALLMNLEFRMKVTEDIGRQFLTYRERKPVEHFLKLVDDIALRDITDIGQKLISSPLTMASYGDVLNVPSYESVGRKFYA